MSINLVALATAINVDGLKLGLGGNSHGGFELNAEIVLLLSNITAVKATIFMYLLAGHNDLRGFDADSWHFCIIFEI